MLDFLFGVSEVAHMDDCFNRKRHYSTQIDCSMYIVLGEGFTLGQLIVERLREKNRKQKRCVWPNWFQSDCEQGKKFYLHSFTSGALD